MWGPETIDERFDGAGLDTSVWTPAYLPAWSSTAAAGATYTIGDGGLRLSIPDTQGLWCADRHEGALRVSAVQSGNRSGAVGSPDGQQPFRDGLTVREAQATRWGFTPRFGRVEVTCRATIGPRSMFSAWMVGLEDEPDRCGEICLVEVFGHTVGHDGHGRPTAAVGRGIHAFRDPTLREEFAAPVRALDVSHDHCYAVDWRPGSVSFLIDGTTVHSAGQAPAYPMQLILGVFDFPDREGSPDEPVPELVVRSVSGRAPAD